MTDPMNDIKTDPMFDFTAKPMMTDIIAGPSLVQKECRAYLRLLDINFRLHAINWEVTEWFCLLEHTPAIIWRVMAVINPIQIRPRLLFTLSQPSLPSEHLYSWDNIGVRNMWSVESGSGVIFLLFQPPATWASSWGDGRVLITRVPLTEVLYLTFYQLQCDFKWQSVKCGYYQRLWFRVMHYSKLAYIIFVLFRWVNASVMHLDLGVIGVWQHEDFILYSLYLLCL